MEFQPNPRQTFVMLHLLITHEEPKQSQVPLSTFTAKDRKELINAGLINLEKRQRAQHIVLTDKAWDWARYNLDAPISKTQQAAPLLHMLLTTLKEFVRVQDMPLVELLMVRDRNTAVAAVTNGAVPQQEMVGLPNQIIAAYRSVSGGKLHVDVRLAALRAQLPNISGDLVDQTLLQMQRDGSITLMRLDDPQNITAEDAVAALDVHGDKRHIIYMKG